MVAAAVAIGVGAVVVEEEEEVMNELLVMDLARGARCVREPDDAVVMVSPALRRMLLSLPVFFRSAGDRGGEKRCSVWPR